MKAALYLFLGALAMHVLYLVQFAQSPFFWVPCLDAQYHDLMARQILEGKLSAEPYFRAPGYGYFLAGIYAVFGVGNYVAVRVIHALLGSAGVVMLYLIGRRLFSARVGLLAGISMALYGPLIFQISDLHTTVIEVFCLLAFALALVHLMERRAADEMPLGLAAACGLAIGIWACARPNALLAVPVALLWLPGRWLSKGFIATCAAFLAGVLILPLAATARNAIVARDPVFIAWFGGVNLYLANNPTCNGMSMGTPKRYHFREEYEEYVAIFGKREAEQAVGRPMSYGEIDRYWRHRAGDWLRQEPAAALRLVVKKLVLIFNRAEIRNITGYDYFRAEWATVLGLAVFGFWYAGPFGLLGIGLAWRTQRASRPLAALALLYLLHLVLFIAADRYRTAVIPLLLLFAAYAVFCLADSVRAGNWKGLVVPAAALVPLLVFVNVSWYQTNPPTEWAKDYWTAGIRYNRLRKYPEAEAQMRKGLQLDPVNSDIWQGLGEALYYQQKFAEAAATFAEGAKCAKDASQLLYNLALCDVELGRVKEAQALLTRLVQQDNDYRLAQSLLRELESRTNAPPASGQTVSPTSSK